MSILAAFAVPHPPLLIPGVGEGKEQEVQKTEHSFEEVARRCADLNPETLVIFSPHATLYADYFHISPGTGARGDFGSFGVPQAAYAVTYDVEFVANLENLLATRGIRGGTLGERDPHLDHGTMVPLHFFGKAAGDEGGAGEGVRVVRIGLSGLSRKEHFDLGQAVAEVAQELSRKTVIIASGDLSHKLLASGPYGFTPEGPEFDKEVCAALAQGDFARMMAIDESMSEAAAECGLRSFIMMAGALEGREHSSELLSYEGPFGVGYAVAAFMVGIKDEHGVAGELTIAEGSEPVSGQTNSLTSAPEESLPVALARQSLQSYFDLGLRRPTPDTPALQTVLGRYRDFPETHALYDELTNTQAGAFVSLHKHGELRGCIGTIAATQESVVAEIVHNAISAAREDPRFSPVGEDELSLLEINVDVLGKAEPVYDRATLDAQRYGVIVSSGYRRGLLLPALDGVDTPEEQIAIALSKAHIRADEPYELERFEVVRYT